MTAFRRRAVAVTAAAALLTLASGATLALADPASPTPTPSPSESAPATPEAPASPKPSSPADDVTKSAQPPAGDEKKSDEPKTDAPESGKPADETKKADEPTKREPAVEAVEARKSGSKKVGTSDGQTVEAGLTAEELAAELIGHGVEVSNAEYTGHAAAAGVFTGFKNSVGIGSGVALSTGSVVDGDTVTSSLLGPNDGTSNSGMGTAGDEQLSEIVDEETNDAAVLEFDFTAAGSDIEFSYVFGSEEYPDFVDSNYNDVFALSVNGTNCALIPGTDQAVSINNVNAETNADHFRDNYTDTSSFDTQMDGMTTELECHAQVEPGETNHIRLAIADTADDAYDSSVLIKADSVQVPTPPEVEDLKYSIYNVETAEVELTGTDVNGDDLTFSVEQQPENGELTGEGTNLTYTPNEGFVGTDTFTYVAHDGEFDSEPATVTINVKENTPPTAVDDSYETGFMTELKVNGVLDNDKDPDDDQDLTVVDATETEHGTLDLKTDGTFVYTPDDGFSGTDTFSYAASDGLATSAPATVTITVLGNDPAVGKDDTYTTAFETALVVDAPGVLKNDSDPDGDDISAVKATQPENGAVKLTRSGKLTYTPEDGFSGKDTFTYQVNDGFRNSEPVTVTINVQDAPDTPGSDGPGLGDTGSEVSPSMIIFSVAALIAGAGALIVGRKLRR